MTASAHDEIWHFGVIGTADSPIGHVSAVARGAQDDPNEATADIHLN